MKLFEPILISLLLALLLYDRSYHYPNYFIIKPTPSYEPTKKSLALQLEKHFDKPYVWAEEGPDAFDCSGLTYHVFGKMKLDIPRVAREQAKVGITIDCEQNLTYGDLIFFTPQHKPNNPINHVGIYLNNGDFAHASSKSRSVTIGNLRKDPIYAKRVKVCKRYIDFHKKVLYLDENATKHQFTTNRFWTSPWQQGMPLPKKAVPD